MRIVEMETFILRRPDVIEAGDSSQDLFLVELRTDDGLTGLGEADEELSNLVDETGSGGGALLDDRLVWSGFTPFL